MSGPTRTEPSVASETCGRSARWTATGRTVPVEAPRGCEHRPAGAAAEWLAGQAARHHRGRIGGEVDGQRSGSEAGGVPVEQAQAAPLAEVLTAVVRAEALDDDVRELEQMIGHRDPPRLLDVMSSCAMSVWQRETDRIRAARGHHHLRGRSAASTPGPCGGRGRRPSRPTPPGPLTVPSTPIIDTMST